MQLSTVLGAVALLATSAMASPIQAQDIAARAPHTAPTADVTEFHAVRNGTHILYSALVQVHADAPAAKFTHATAGRDVPDVSGMWDSSDPQLYLRFLRVPSASAGQDLLRLVLSDVHVTGSTINLAYFSPVDEWAGKGRVVYTGPSKFVLKD
ncbi:hypothetical protein QBC39DRAFT_369379 [Podospora conica]|nr:hypothetical protein QBC39DRAFT_369379 [Schizothecium conicum]